MMAARVGFEPTALLRKQIAEGQNGFDAKEKERRDAEFDARGRNEALAVLGSLPQEPPVTAKNLPEHLKSALENERKKDRDARANMAGLNVLLKKLEGREDVSAEQLQIEIAEEAENHRNDVSNLAEKAAELKAALDKLIKEYKGFQDLVPRGPLPVLTKPLQENAEKKRVADFREREELDFLGGFETDRTASTPRLIEQDLLVLRAKLKQFPEGPLEDVIKCEARDQLKKFVEDLQAEVDKAAHKAKCHKCGSASEEKGLVRSPDAKDLIFAKVKELEELAKGAKEARSAGEKIDQGLGTALESMRNEVDENGKTAGKMLGVLVCKDGDGKTVLLYGYSGTLGANSRIAERKYFLINLQIDPAGKLKDNKVQQAGAQIVIDKANEALEKTPEFTELEAARARLAELEREKKEINLKLNPPKKKPAAKGKKGDTEVTKAEAEPTEAPIDKEALQSALELNAQKIEKEEIVAAKAEEKMNATVEAKRLQKAKQDKQQLEAYAKRLAEQKKLQDEKLKPPKELEPESERARADEYVRAKQEEAGKEQEDLKRQLEEAKKKVVEASKLDDELENSTASHWVRSIPEDGFLVGAGGDIVSLEALNKDHFDTPHGVCSAPKMIQAARAMGLKIVSMAEAWYGGGPNPHGELVASCNTCMKNIGFQFCEVKSHG
jgi:hypothetical protein